MNADKLKEIKIYVDKQGNQYCEHELININYKGVNHLVTKDTAEIRSVDCWNEVTEYEATELPDLLKAERDWVVEQIKGALGSSSINKLEHIRKCLDNLDTHTLSELLKAERERVIGEVKKIVKAFNHNIDECDCQRCRIMKELNSMKGEK
jgi:hypothetical protein